MERSGNPVQRGCGVSERIKKLIEFLTVEDSLQGLMERSGNPAQRGCRELQIYKNCTKLSFFFG
jgi:hypothetical protein